MVRLTAKKNFPSLGDLSSSYADCLNRSVKSAWSIDDCFQRRQFDFSKRFLPERVASVRGIECLNDYGKLKLNQIRGNSYCHIFSFVEEFIIPLMLDQAREDVYGDETRLRFLLRFAEEETKHQAMLKRAMDQIAAGLGVSCQVISGRETVAKAVLGKSRLAALLFTSMVEWLTQLHYVDHVRDSMELDPLFRDILKFHWIDESQHARADSLLIKEVAGVINEQERSAAIDELLGLCSTLDKLLAQQTYMDIDSLAKVMERTLSDEDRREIFNHQRQAYRWTFLVSGLEHPSFLQVVNTLGYFCLEKIRDSTVVFASQLR